MTKERAIHLYRAIMKAHIAKLPLDIRHLGSSYVRNEFKLHKNVTSEPRLREFYTAWDAYLAMISKQADVGKFGKDMSVKESVHLTEDQKEKLAQLKEEVKEDMKATREMLEKSSS
eukprot:gene4918-5398_t